jgi:hypothetical protein
MEGVSLACTYYYFTTHDFLSKSEMPNVKISKILNAYFKMQNYVFPNLAYIH